MEGHGDDAVGAEGVDKGVHQGCGGGESAVVPEERQLRLADGGIERGAVVPDDVEGIADEGVAVEVVGGQQAAVGGVGGEGVGEEGAGEVVFEGGVEDDGRGGVSEGEVEGGDGVAACGVEGEDAVQDGGVGDDGVGGEGDAVPGEDVAGVGDGVAVRGGADIQHQCPQGVAAEGRGVQEVAVGAWKCIVCPVEGIGLVVADGGVDGVVVSGIHVQRH